MSYHKDVVNLPSETYFCAAQPWMKGGLMRLLRDMLEVEIRLVAKPALVVIVDRSSCLTIIPSYPRTMWNFIKNPFDALFVIDYAQRFEILILKFDYSRYHQCRKTLVYDIHDFINLSSKLMTVCSAVYSDKFFAYITFRLVF